MGTPALPRPRSAGSPQCPGQANQEYTLQPNGEITVYGGSDCLDAYNQGKTAGTVVDIYACNGGANQQWQAENGELVNPTSGQCLDDPDGSTTNGTQLQIYACWGGSNQKWTVP